MQAMRPTMLRSIVMAMAALLVAVGVESIKFEIEHSLDGGITFAPKLTITGQLEWTQSLDAVQVPIRAEALAALKRLVEEDGYVLRVMEYVLDPSRMMAHPVK